AAARHRMNVRALPALALYAVATAFVATGNAATTPREMHGSADTFAAPGVALAWGILRGADENATTVVVRIVTDPAVFSEVAVTGSDPFTAEQKVMLPLAASAAIVNLRMSRAHFAAFPRTELQFHAAASGSGRTES